MKKHFYIVAIIFCLIGCTERVELKNEDVDIMMSYCSNNGGIKTLSIYGDLDRYRGRTFHIYCNDGAKFTYIRPLASQNDQPVVNSGGTCVE